MNEDLFQQRVVEALAPHASGLVGVLRQLVEHSYPGEVRALEFEVFTDGFTDGFPVRAFFMDADNTEFFVYEDGKAQYPSPVDPELLHIERVFDLDLEHELEAVAPDADTYTLAGEALVPWFAKCWAQAGGLGFSRAATIQLHDDTRSYDLKLQRWCSK
jgi:hypothetical protein